MDDKKKTNKHQHSFFAGIGVDALWRNNTLFRSWSPNNTHDALNWMMTKAIVELVPARLRARIQCVFTDHCGVMTPILSKVCGDADVLPSAKHYLCVYHLVRNFFQDFGKGHSKRWSMKSSTQKYRKGGEIVWAYAWQKNCASAIFRLGVCESREEFEQCKQHVLSYIKKTKDIGHASLRDEVLQFFAQKFEDADKWSLYSRVDRPSLNISSTSRAEGEFSAIRNLKLSTATGFNRAMFKIKWQSDRRFSRKLFLCQRNMNSVIKRKSVHCPDMQEWVALDRELTTHYLKMVEKEMELSQKCTYKLTELTTAGDALKSAIVKVFVPRQEHQDDVPLDESDGEDDADNIEADEEIGFDDDADEKEEEDAEDKEGTEEGSEQTRQVPMAHEVSEPLKEDEDWTPFIYQRVRTIEVKVISQDFVQLMCNCGHMIRTRYVCRHLLCLLRAIHKDRFGLTEEGITFHPRVLKSLYWGVHHSEKRIAESDCVTWPAVKRDVFDEWLKVQPSPSETEVPLVGCPDHQHDSGDAPMDDGDAPTTSSGRSNRSRQQKLHDQKMGKVQDNHFELLDLCKTNRQLLDDYQKAQEELLGDWRSRRKPNAPGRKRVDRIRGVADVKKSTHALRKKQKVTSDSDPVLLLRERVRKYGLQSGTYVQIENREGELWFMRIVDGKVLDSEGDDPALAGALWCESNCVNRLSKTHTKPVPCEIRGILDTGSLSKFNALINARNSSNR